MKTYTLYEANIMVREAVETAFYDDIWVVAEIAECRENRGHCYMELVSSNVVTSESNNVDTNSRPSQPARASAKCWASTWRLLRPHFERVTGQSLARGMQVMLCVAPQFHEQYGFSWIVSDINPEFTLGDMARRRQEIIRQLKEEGVFDLQKQLSLPMFCQRIAVISAETAAGYGDFIDQLQNNPYGFHFHIDLFPAVMQGDMVEPSIISALETIYNVNGNEGAKARGNGDGNLQQEELPLFSYSPESEGYDCVVIIRGGGATLDLSGFDSLLLAENVANFPLPIITGIGHDRDETILDMISHTRVKTPTAAAAFLIDHLAIVAERLEQFSIRIPQLVGRRFMEEHHRLDNIKNRTRQALKQIFEKRRYQIETLKCQLRSFDPQLILKRGYSLTTKDGKVVRDIAALKEGDIIETRLAGGMITSTITSKD